ncbi:MAG: hypothetical protein GX661_02470, partial [Acholeplasmataceae bacterium]|nr:hypothetical protein [Acholeplasmataceae bacterium]
MSRKIIIFIFMFFLIPSSLMVKDTHAYWVNPNDGECMFTGVVDLGYWRRIPILEKVRIISNPKMGDEFFYQDELYVVINNSVTEITDDAEWWVNNNPWNGVNLVSTNWVTNNYYDQYFLPIRHNDSYWLAHSSEASGIEPGTTVSWFKIDEGYIPENHYPKNYIICYGDNNGPRYWIASQNIQPNNAPD